MTHPTVTFGFGAPHDIAEAPTLVSLAKQADRDGLDIFSIPDHPYLGERLDAYAALGFVLGSTEKISGMVNVTNFPLRPAPMLSRTVTSLTALSGGRVVLGAGAGGLPERIAAMGVPQLAAADAVEAFEEAIVLIKELSGGGPAVSHHGKHFRVDDIEPSPAPAPPVWTGSVGPKSLAVTGRVADGWIPGHAADWLSDRYRTSRPIIDEAAASAGRDPREVRTIFNLPGTITERPASLPRDRSGRWIGGSVDQWVTELAGAVLEHGADGFTLFADTFGSQPADVLARWAREIAPAVRQIVAAERSPARSN